MNDRRLKPHELDPVTEGALLRAWMRKGCDDYVETMADTYQLYVPSDERSDRLTGLVFSPTQMW